jgi:DNA polymerase-3 subunit beta
MTATATARRQTTGGTRLNLARSDLKALLDILKPAVASASCPTQVLRNVIVRDGTASAYNGDLQISAIVPFDCLDTLLPHARLSQILGLCEADDLTLTFAEGTCTVRCGSMAWRLPLEDIDSYPDITKNAVSPVCRIPADQFVRAVKSVIHAADGRGSRPAFAGVLIDVADGTVVLAATDGRRLATYELEIDQAVDDSRTLIPASSVEAIAAIAADSDDAVQIEANGNEAVATIADKVIACRLLSAPFPDWRKVIPDREVEASVVDAAPLLAATRAVAVCTSETSCGVVFSTEGEALKLTSESSEIGKSAAEVPFIAKGVAAKIKLHPKYVAEFVRSIDDPACPVELEIADGESAAVFRCDSTTEVIMPLSMEGP